MPRKPVPNPHHDERDMIPELEAAIAYARACRPADDYSVRREDVLRTREKRHLRLIKGEKAE